MDERRTNWNRAIADSWIAIIVILVVLWLAGLSFKGCQASTDLWRIHAERGDVKLDKMDGWLPKEVLRGVESN